MAMFPSSAKKSKPAKIEKVVVEKVEEEEDTDTSKMKFVDMAMPSYSDSTASKPRSTAFSF